MIRVRLSKTAERDILDATIRWRVHHSTSVDLFQDELVAAIELIELFPDAGHRARTTRYKNARVIVMRKTGYLLVYRRETKARVLVLALRASAATPVQP